MPAEVHTRPLVHSFAGLTEFGNSVTGDTFDQPRVGQLSIVEAT